MHPRTAKNNYRLLWLVLMSVICTALLPVESRAQLFNPNQYYSAFSSGGTYQDSFAPPDDPRVALPPPVLDPANGNICPGEGYSKRIVYCIKNTIVYGVYKYLSVVSFWLARTIAVCIMFSLMLWAILLIAGKIQAPTKDAFMLFLKMGGVAMFTWNFAGLFPAILDSLEYLLNVVSQYILFTNNAMECPNVAANQAATWVVWDTVDCSMETLVGGIFSPLTLVSGITGFLVACIFSGASGFFVALMGVMLIAMLMFAIVRAVYVFISAYMGFALMVLISPLFIPLLLFSVTAQYFEKWLKLTLGFILQPIFLFAYLAMLSTAYDIVVYSGPNSIYRSIAGTAVGNEIGPGGFTLGTWLMYSGGYGEKSNSPKLITVAPSRIMQQNLQKEDIGILGDIGDALVDQSFWESDMTSFLGDFMVDMPVTVVRWDWLAFYSGYGSNTIGYIINLFLSFFMALMTAYIFLTMLDSLPFIASGIAGEATAIPTLGAGKMGPSSDKLLGTLKEKFAAAFRGS